MSGPAAFPGGNFESCEPTYGMSLRDWFAGQALAGMFASGATLDHDGSHLGINRARTAYAVADAMLAAREGEVP